MDLLIKGKNTCGLEYTVMLKRNNNNNNNKAISGTPAVDAAKRDVKDFDWYIQHNVPRMENHSRS